MEDYELMHRMIENERSERMVETILSGYLSNLSLIHISRIGGPALPAVERGGLPGLCDLCDGAVRLQAHRH